MYGPDSLLFYGRRTKTSWSKHPWFKSSQVQYERWINFSLWCHFKMKRSLSQKNVSNDQIFARQWERAIWPLFVSPQYSPYMDPKENHPLINPLFYYRFLFLNSKIGFRDDNRFFTSPGSLSRGAKHSKILITKIRLKS